MSAKASVGLYFEALWQKHDVKLKKAAELATIWGSRPMDLASPINIAGRIAASVPVAIQLVNAMNPGGQLTHAQDLLKLELPFDFAEGLVSYQVHAISFFEGMANILSLRLERRDVSFGMAADDGIKSWLLDLGEGVILGMLVWGKPSGTITNFHSNRPTEEVLRQLSHLLKASSFGGVEVSSTKSVISYSGIVVSQNMVFGSEFANDYVQVADRIRRFENVGIQRSLMLLGPPGCGKTQMAKMVALQLGKLIIHVSSEVLNNTYLLHMLTTFFPKSVLICDDFDRYDGDTQQLLASLEQKGLSLILTCNTIWGFDKAAIRVGRIDEIIEMPMPDLDMRRRLCLQFEPSMPPDVLDWAGENMEKMTPAEIREAVKCYTALGFTDFKVDVARIRKQADMAAELLYDIAEKKGWKTKRPAHPKTIEEEELEEKNR